MTRSACLLAASLILAGSPTARAGLVVEIGDATLFQGHATVNVTLANTGPASISLNQYGFQFQVVPVGNAPSELSFVDPQPQPFGDSKYVFYENSLADPGPLGNVSTTSTPDDTYTGGDGTLDGTNVTIAAGSSATLLTQLQVSLNGLYLPTPGTFQIVLESGPDSVFQYESGGKELSLRYTSVSGTITDSGGITLPSPVPEPSTITLLASGVLALLAYARRGPARTSPGMMDAGL